MSVLSYLIYPIVSLFDITVIAFMILYVLGLLVVPMGRALWRDVIDKERVFFHHHHYRFH